jgi:hypothetical protein
LPSSPPPPPPPPPPPAAAAAGLGLRALAPAAAAAGVTRGLMSAGGRSLQHSTAISSRAHAHRFAQTARDFGSCTVLKKQAPQHARTYRLWQHPQLGTNFHQTQVRT